jgi:hypothetical protein
MLLRVKVEMSVINLAVTRSLAIIIINYVI